MTLDNTEGKNKGVQEINQPQSTWSEIKKCDKEYLNEK